MKSLPVKLGLIFSIIGLIIFANIKVWGADWVYCLSDSLNNKYYYDTESISRDTGIYTYGIKVDMIIVEVWVKIVYSSEGRRQIIRLRKRSGLPTEGFENLSYSKNRESINCNSRTISTRSSIDYQHSGGALESFEFSPHRMGAYKSITPESVGEGLHEAFCK